MDPGAATTPLAAFTAGLVTSLHCSVMCGPLGCALLASPGTTPRERQAALGAYHGMRVASYTVIGSMLGALGLAAAGLFDAAPSRWLPWMLALLFLLLALGAERWIPQPRFLSHWLLKLKFRTVRSPVMAASILGALTPFLPCGPLYLTFGVAVFAGSMAGGGLLMASFALGTLPLYWLAQSQLLRFRPAPATLRHVRRGLALTAALLIGWRAAALTGTGSALLDGILCH